MRHKVNARGRNEGAALGAASHAINLGDVARESFEVGVHLVARQTERVERGVTGSRWRGTNPLPLPQKPCKVVREPLAVVVGEGRRPARAAAGATHLLLLVADVALV